MFSSLIVHEFYKRDSSLSSFDFGELIGKFRSFTFAFIYVYVGVCHGGS